MPPRPSERRPAFCDVCKCHVSGPWGVHTAGIRHRRNVVRLHHFGSSAPLVVSLFEDVPTPANAAAGSRSRSRDPILAQPSTSVRPPRNKAAHDDGAASRISSAVLRQLVHETGTNGHLYHAAAQRFTPQLLRPALVALPQLLQQAAATGAYEHPLGAPVGQLAALAGSLPLPPSVTALHIHVPFQTYGAECLATASALRLLATSLRRDTRVQRLTISIHLEHYVQALVQGGTGFTRLPVVWGHILATLRGAFDANITIHEVRLQSPPAVLPADEVARLHGAMVSQPARLRLAVLLGQHRRVGAGSQLYRLPQALVEKLLGMAVPLQQRSVACETLLPEIVTASSSSDYSGSSGDDDSSDSDDESGSSDDSGSTSEDDDGN